MADRHRITVTRRIPDAATERLRKTGEVWVSPHDRPLTTEELHAAVSGADAIVSLLHDRIDGDVLDAAGPRLRCVANVAVGYDNIDVAAASERGIQVTNTPGVLTDDTADIAMALMLAATRRVGEGERLIRDRQPWQWHMFFMLGRSLNRKTLGIVGLGAIGQATARRARAFGMEIQYAGRARARPEVEVELGAAWVPLDQLLATSDVASLHCPLSPATHHLIDAARLELMRPDACLINTSRGAIVDEDALVAALSSGRLAAAGLDVYEHEPDVHPGLLELDNVVLAPHLGSATIETRTAMGVLAADNVVAILEGREPITAVSPPAG